jgi:hypothetical protein
VDDVGWPSPIVCCHAMSCSGGSGKYGLQIDLPLGE